MFLLNQQYINHNYVIKVGNYYGNEIRDRQAQRILFNKCKKIKLNKLMKQKFYYMT